MREVNLFVVFPIMTKLIAATTAENNPTSAIQHSVLSLSAMPYVKVISHRLCDRKSTSVLVDIAIP